MLCRAKRCVCTYGTYLICGTPTAAAAQQHHSRKELRVSCLERQPRGITLLNPTNKPPKIDDLVFDFIFVLTLAGIKSSRKPKIATVDIENFRVFFRFRGHDIRSLMTARKHLSTSLFVQGIEKRSFRSLSRYQSSSAINLSRTAKRGKRVANSLKCRTPFVAKFFCASRQKIAGNTRDGCVQRSRGLERYLAILGPDEWPCFSRKSIVVGRPRVARMRDPLVWVKRAIPTCG